MTGPATTTRRPGPAPGDGRPRPVSSPRLARLLRRNARSRLTALLLLPVCVIWVYPFLWMVSAALKTDAEIFSGLGLLPSDPQWGNFARAWTDAGMDRYFLNTVVVTGGSVLLVVLSGAMIGYALGRYDFPGRRILLVAYVATVFVPEGYTVVPIFDLVNSLGLADSLLGVTLAVSGGANVIIVLLFAGFFNQLPKELEEAAVIDGAGFVRVFWTVMLPLARPVVATAIILQFMQAWNAYLLPLVLTLSRPELRTLSVGMTAFQGQYFNDWSGMAAAATISLVPIIVVFVVLQRHFVDAVAGAVKQ